MNADDRSVLVACAAVDGIGSRTLEKIRSWCAMRGVRLDEFWRAPDRAVGDVALTMKQCESIREFSKKYTLGSYQQYLAEQHITPVVLEDSYFPRRLLPLAGCPQVLFTQGNASLLCSDLPTIAIVGTRHPSEYGKMVTQKIAKEVLEYNACLVSGFMYGVDQIAHQTALELSGSSIGVLGFGFCHFYPSSLRKLRDQFLDAGNTLVTEFAPDVHAKAGNFPIRNRIVAGMSDAVIVTEATLNSGSLITAHYGAEYGKVVCAVGGAITSPGYQGIQRLVNEGVKLISSGKDVMDELGIVQQVRESDPNTFLNQVYAHLQRDPKSSANTLAQRLNTSISRVLVALTDLEIQGRIKRSGECCQLLL